MGPRIVIIFQYISNKIQHYTVYFIWKLLYMFRMVPSPIISSANFIYSIWYLSQRYCYLPLSVGTGLSVLWVAYGVTHTRCCRYSCLRSWWWVMITPNSLFYLETALHVSDGTITHHQERKLYLQHLVIVTPLLLSAAISWNWFEYAVGGVRCDTYQML